MGNRRHGFSTFGPGLKPAPQYVLPNPKSNFLRGGLGYVYGLPKSLKSQRAYCVHEEAAL